MSDFKDYNHVRISKPGKWVFLTTAVSKYPWRYGGLSSFDVSFHILIFVWDCSRLTLRLEACVSY